MNFMKNPARLSIHIALSMVFALFFAPVSAQALKPEKVKVNKTPLSVEQSLVSFNKKSKNKKATVTVYLKLAKEHKAYDDIFKIKNSDSNLKVSKPEVSPLRDYIDKFSGGKERLIMENEARLRFSISSDKAIDGEKSFALTYQACTAAYCLLPKDLKFKVDFGNPSQTDLAPDATVEDSADWSSFSMDSFFANFDKQSTWLILLIVYLFGFLTAFTPCVFPMIPITMGILGFSDSSGRWKGFTIGLSYSLGLSLTYALVGVVVAMTGGFIGQALTNPFVIWGIFAFYVITALSMAGLFPMKAPLAVQNSFSKIENKGIIGAFIAGSLGGIIASPCVGPAVAAVLAYVAQSGKPMFGFFTLFAFGMGLGSLFILIGTFYGEINARLKPGKWLGYVKYVLAALILAGAFLFIKPHLSFLNNSHTHQDAESAGLWKPFTMEAFDKSIKEGKPVIVDFRADWCAACHELEQHTFSTEGFKTETEGSITLLKFDATKPTEAQQKDLQRFEVFGLPTVIFVSSKGQTLDDLTLTGFEEWEDFAKRLQALKKESGK
jgi:thiol:disulfide interchange protein DsbD